MKWGNKIPNSDEPEPNKNYCNIDSLLSGNLLEYWNVGIVGQKLEQVYFKIRLSFIQIVIYPFFQHSTIPFFQFYLYGV